MIAVVGAGIAGLTAAIHLARSGKKVTLIEANAFAGGRYSTVGEMRFEHRGATFTFPVDHGLHGFWRQYRNFNRLLQTLGISGRQIGVPTQELVVGEHGVEIGARVQNAPVPDLLAPAWMLSAPHLAREAVRNGLLKTLMAGGEVLHALTFDPMRDVEKYDDITVAEYLRDWPGWLQRLFCALTHSGFFLDPEEVSLAAFFTGLSVYSVSDKRDSSFTTLDDAAGPGLIDPMVATLRTLGAEVRFGARVESLSDDGSIVVCGERLQTEGVVLALDPRGLRALKVPDALTKFFEAHPIPRAVASVAVRLFFTKSPDQSRAPSGVFADAPVDNFFWLEQLQRPFRAWHTATGGAVLEGHLYGSRAANALNRADQEVIADVLAAAEKGWPELRGSLVHAHVHRNEPTHVAFTPGAMSKLPTMETPLQNVVLAGDFVQTPWPTLYLERACLTGLLAARRLGAKTEEPLRPFDAAPSVARARPLLRALRDFGVFPRASLGRRKNH